MSQKTVRVLSFIFLLFFFAVNFSFSADTSSTAEPYTKKEFPEWAHDVRRTEIITFGSLPFVTIWVSIAYSAIVNGEFNNPLDKSSSNLSTTDQKRIIQIAALSSISLGLTDLTLNLIQRGIKGAHAKRIRSPDAIKITPYKMPDENKSPDSKNEGGQPEPAPVMPERPLEYMQGGIESAIF